MNLTRVAAAILMVSPVRGLRPVEALRRAVLKVPKPTNKYVIAKASWAFNGDRPTMMVYFTDDYGGGYLAANAQGKVIKIVPSGS